MSAREVIAGVAFEGTILGAPIRFEMGHKKADAIISALDAAGFKVIHRDDLMKFLKAMEAAKETT